MATYTTEELISSSKLIKNFWAYISKVSSHELDKIWVLKNNKLDAVIISWDTYDLFEELLEYIEIFDSIKDRVKSDDFIDWDELLKEFDLTVA